MSNKLSYNVVTLNDNFLRYHNSSYVKSMAIDMLVQSNNEWEASLIVIKQKSRRGKENVK